MLFLYWLFVMILLYWAWKGFQKIPVGNEAIILWLGARTHKTKREGWRWNPWPWSIQVVDVRQQIMQLDVLEATTLDGVKVKISATVTFAIRDAYKYLDVEPSGIKKGIDDARDQIIRIKVRELNLDEVFSSHDDLGTDLLAKLSTESTLWGIKIVKVAVTEISAADPKVQDDMELRKREALQKAGQRVEMEHIRELYADLQTSSNPAARGLSPDQAYETMLYITGKADPKKVYSVDPAVVTAIMSFLGRRP